MTEIPHQSMPESVDLAKPGELIRCLLSEKQARDLAKRLYGLTVTGVKEFNGYDDRNFHLTVADEHCNNFIDEVWPDGYVLKIVNTLDSKKRDYLDAQSLMMIHLDSKMPGCCPLPVKNVNGKLSSLESIWQEDEEGNTISEGPTEHVVRLLVFRPGLIFHQIPQPDIELFYEAGKFLGKLDNAFKDFSNPALNDRLHLWSMYRVPNVKDFTYAVRDIKRRHLAEEVVEAFCQQVLPNYDKLQKGVIHGDFNEQNILVAPRCAADSNKSTSTDCKYKQTGIIDFGDAGNACYVFEIGLSMMYLATCSKELDFIEVSGHVLAGYLSEMPLSDLEFDLLRTVMASRYAQSLALGEYFYRLDNNEYCLTTSTAGWPQLEKLWETPKEDVIAVWRRIIHSRKEQCA